jgi:PemK-like, MazF-like toxin of type II toxin-antitoxin system
MARVQPGEVWMVDLGLAAKVRPCLILSDHPADDELALVIIIPHTTAIRGNRWELVLPKPFFSGFTNLSSMTRSDLGCWVHEKAQPSTPRSEP